MQRTIIFKNSFQSQKLNKGNIHTNNENQQKKITGNKDVLYYDLQLSQREQRKQNSQNSSYLADRIDKQYDQLLEQNQLIMRYIYELELKNKKNIQNWYISNHEKKYYYHNQKEKKFDWNEDKKLEKTEITIHFDHSQKADYHMEIINKLQKQNQKMTMLNLVLTNQQMVLKEFFQIIQDIKILKYLKQLSIDLGQNQIDDHNCERYQDNYLERFEHLQTFELYLDSKKLKGKLVEQILNNLDFNSIISKLKIWTTYEEFSDQQIKFWQKRVQAIKTLTFLELGINAKQIQEEEAKQFQDNLQKIIRSGQCWFKNKTELKRW